MFLTIVRKHFAKLPAPVALVLGFSMVMLFMALIARALPPARDLHAECKKQCHPRFSRVVTDKSRPMSAKGESMQPKICECY